MKETKGGKERGKKGRKREEEEKGGTRRKRESPQQQHPQPHSPRREQEHLEKQSGSLRSRCQICAGSTATQLWFKNSEKSLKKNVKLSNFSKFIKGINTFEVRHLNLHTEFTSNFNFHGKTTPPNYMESHLRKKKSKLKLEYRITQFIQQ